MNEINIKLSIIMPCYNCKNTVEEALKSVYEQNFSFPFEVIMVDDGSLDGTRDLIVDLSKKYPNVTCHSHDINKGGGAARNTGIKKSKGDLIFCLDSDNILCKNSLNIMVRYLMDCKCDGVAFFERRFFKNTKVDKFLSHKNKILNRSIILEDLFNNSGTLLDNFLFTRESFNLSGGYPENHGFDTQCFEMRFLAKGFSVNVCPETIFYHRQSAKNRSYFERVYEKGEMSRNYYLIFEDIMYLFSPEVRKQILHYQIFDHASLDLGDNLKSYIDQLFVKYGKDFFVTNLSKYLVVDGFKLFYDNTTKSSEISDIFCLAVYYYKQNNFLSSIDCYKQLIASGLNSQLLYFNIFRNYLAFSGKYDLNKIEDEVSVLARSFIPYTQRRIFSNGIWSRLVNRINQYIFNI